MQQNRAAHAANLSLKAENSAGCFSSMGVEAAAFARSLDSLAQMLPK
jgi:hypothetical protein